MKIRKSLLSFVAGSIIFSPFLLKDVFADNLANVKPVYGYCYSPFREGQSPETGVFPTQAQEKQDLDIIKPVSKVVRTYGNDNNLYYIPQFCNENGIECVVGSWVSDDSAWNQGVVNRLIQVSNANYPTTKALLVGNEYLLWRNWSSETDLINLINQVNNQTTLPVSTAETYNVWLQHPNLVNACDFIGAHIHPYWEGVSIENAAQHVIDKYNLLEQTYPGKEIQILEVGWPSEGPAYLNAIPSQANQERFIREFIIKAKENDVKYFIFSGFDEPWKAKYGAVESHWGMYDKNRALKPGLENITYNIPGDINLDGQIDLVDLADFSCCWLSSSNSSGPYFSGDINQDGKTDLADLAIMSRNWD